MGTENFCTGVGRVNLERAMLDMSASPRMAALNSSNGSGTASPDVSTGMSSYLHKEKSVGRRWERRGANDEEERVGRKRKKTHLSKLMPVGLPPPNRRASAAGSGRMSP
jgi:hypothetical protein